MVSALLLHQDPSSGKALMAYNSHMDRNSWSRREAKNDPAEDGENLNQGSFEFLH